MINDARIDFKGILAFLDDLQRRQRILDSEVHHDRPPLAGVVLELPSLLSVQQFYSKYESPTSTRFRQASGIAVRMIMQDFGWATTGRKGSLSTRLTVAPRTTTPGAYQNGSTSLAGWFLRAERYDPKLQAQVQTVQNHSHHRTERR